jgi:hypothetical protein
MVFSVGDVLADSLVRPGGVVVLLVLGQDGLDDGPQDRGPGGLGDCVERGREVGARGRGGT